MEEDPGKKNRDFLKKFVSKDIVRKKGAYWLEEVKTEDPDEWKDLPVPKKETKQDNRKTIPKKVNRKFLKKFISKDILRNKRMEKNRARREWAEEVEREEKEKKRKKALRHPIEPPREFYKYQENKHGKPTKLSKKEKERIRKKAIVETPLVKKTKERKKRK